jgi:hypothetical protein
MAGIALKLEKCRLARLHITVRQTEAAWGFFRRRAE